MRRSRRHATPTWQRVPPGAPMYHGQGGGRPEGTRRRRRPLPTLSARKRGLQGLREAPVRSGLVGLALAGVAAPLAVNQYQRELKIDPSHEAAMKQAAVANASDSNVSQLWQALAQEEVSDEATQRAAAIEENIERFSDFGLTQELAAEIYDHAVQEEIDPDMAFGLVMAESGFKNSATSHVGAVGLTQLMPRTAAWMEPGVRTSDLRDSETNLRIGFKYLRYLLDKYDEDARLALLAYNRGPGTVDRVLKQGKNPDNGYVQMVLARAR
jgi:hypothetical protein